MPGMFLPCRSDKAFSLDLSGWEGVSGAAARFALAHGLSPSHSDPCLLFIGTRGAFTGERRTSAEHVRIVFSLLLCLSLRSGRPYTVFPLTPSDILAQRSLRINLVRKISPKTFFVKNFSPKFSSLVDTSITPCLQYRRGSRKIRYKVFSPFPQLQTTANPDASGGRIWGKPV